MTNLNFTYFKPQALIILIVACGAILLLAKEHLGIQIALFAGIAGTLTLWSRYLWDVRPFSLAFWVDDFSGTYEGMLKYWEIDQNGKKQRVELRHVKVITQNGFEVTVHSFTFKTDGTKSSPSKNLGMFITKTSDGNHFELLYSFQNDGSLEQGFAPYIGTEHLKFRRDEDDSKLISGVYFTNRLPHQTRGEVDLKWVSNDTNHPF